MRVPAGAKLPMLQMQLDAKSQAALTRNEALVCKLARIESISPVTDLPKGCVTIAVTGGTFALPIADIIDLDAEKARLEKAQEKQKKEYGGLKGRLGNPKFVASAPEEVVAESRARLAELEAEAEKLTAALKRLADLA